DVSILRPAAQQGLVIHRLELVRVLVKDLQVADAEVAGAGLEEVRRRERSQDRVAAGAAAGDRDPIAVDEAALDQVACAVDRIVDVDDTPEAVEALAVFPAEAGASAVVDDQVGEAAGRPEL